METMKLSQAIREGAKLRPQVKLQPFDKVFVTGEELIGSCALGAAYEKFFGVAKIDLRNDFVQQEIARKMDWDGHPVITIPYGEYGRKGSIFYAIESLNDTYNWTREKIADFLEKEGY